MISPERNILCVFLIWLTLRCANCLPKEITVGGLFGEEEDERIHNAFKHAVYWINHQHEFFRDNQLVFDTRILQTKDLFKSTKEVCLQMDLSPAALFGPRSPEMSSYANSMCRYLHIPHLEYREEPTYRRTASFSINLHPSPVELAKAYLDVINYYNMDHLMILYASSSGLTKMQVIIQDISKESGKAIHLRQVSSNTNMRELLMEAKRKQWTNILADLNASQTSLLLKMALQQGMINPYHHYVLTTLDIETINLDDYKYNHVNITGFRLVDPKNKFVKLITDDMYIYQMNTRLPLLSMENHNTIPYESALLFDAVLLFAKSLEEQAKYHIIRPVNVSCEGDDVWRSGLDLFNYLNTVKVSGLTGDLLLQHGRRLLFNLDIVQLMKEGLEKTGTWSLDRGLNISSEQRYILLGNKTLVVSSNLKKTLIVSTALEAPYVMLKETTGNQQLKGNDRYEGFCVDLLKSIAKNVGFDYEIKVVPDELYGAYDAKTGEWNGIIKELIEKRADMSMAALTINYEREQYIDFSKPFLNLGISILFRMPKKEKPGLFSFLNPLAMEIWIYLIAAYMTVSFSIFVLARFSPYEWYNPHPCIPETDSVENTFNLSNSFWFAIGTLMQQGSDVNPRAVSTRIVGSTWWFFTLIIISSYTANLAAFLTIERLVSPIESAEDLAKQTEIEYGTRESGTTMSFFKNSQFEIYQRMWNYMKGREKTVMMKSGSDGIERVKKGGYAFFMESTGIDYITKQDCRLMQVGGLLDSKGFGMATPMGSPLRDKLSMAILHFQEEGLIQSLYEKWWKGSENCDADGGPAAGKASPLGVYNVGGIFVVLMGGLALSVIVAVCEFVVKSRKNAREDRESVCSEMAKELRFAVRCHGSSKKINKSLCNKCNDRHARSIPCALDESIDTLPNGVIRLHDMRKSPYHSRKELNNRYKDSGYLHVDYSDTDTM
ncbi:glutamate receptor, ionotropic, invertebrate [Mytilus galloprovincialis]|uniref:Glutamate receptor 1 n=1 Tax=Mytilus galloprovincialis TaxID=29158 RepID=A0A8B6H1F5_MYTGA|nr:glutamate receptor, ionotropic, invertebrate [Mytilus galloprovincialis]